MLKVENRSILIVEDNNELRERTADYFSAANSVVQCSTLSEAFDAVQNRKFDIILLDVILPDGSGLKLLEKDVSTPVVIFSDLGADSNILDGLRAGATDYIVKPSSNEVLEARMALRLLPDESAILSLHNLTVNVSKRTAEYKKRTLNLTSSEFNILVFLMRNAGIFYTANEIYEKVWKMPYLNTTTIKAHLSNLRKKMLAVGSECANLIITEFGKGYAFTGSGNE